MQYLIYGTKCCLIKKEVEDFEWYWYWQLNGDWRITDAPWEIVTENEKEEYKIHYLNGIKHENNKINRAWITVDNMKIGSVNSYGISNINNSIKIGIGIYDSNFIGKGIGNEAVKLWIKFLFNNTNFNRIELDTYSFNKRMIKTALNVGFIEEGKQREVRSWNNTWVDKINFGILRREFNS